MADRFLTFGSNRGTAGWFSSLISLLALLCTFSMPVALAVRESPSGWIEDESKPAASAVLKAGAGKVMLQGGVEHSVQLPSLPATMRAGASFDEKNLPDTSKREKWYMIPDWFAGEWLRDQETVISTYYFDSHQQVNEPKTIALHETAEFGEQRDRAGNIWHYRLASKGVAERDSTLSVAIVESQEPLEVTDKKVVMRDVFVELQVNKSTMTIMESNQAESITTYTPWNDGLIRTFVSVKFFQEDGSPKALQKNVSFEKRTKPFAVLNEWKGQNLRQSFIDFLHCAGKDDLVPGN